VNSIDKETVEVIGSGSVGTDGIEMHCLNNEFTEEVLMMSSGIFNQALQQTSFRYSPSSIITPATKEKIL
jgi:hypothetical protein